MSAQFSRYIAFLSAQKVKISARFEMVAIHNIIANFVHNTHDIDKNKQFSKLDISIKIVKLGVYVHM